MRVFLLAPLIGCMAEGTGPATSGESPPSSPPRSNGPFSAVPTSGPEDAPAFTDPPCVASYGEGAMHARLLTRFEYDNTVRDLLGDSTRPARDFPPENRTLAFDNDARAHTVSPLLVEQFMDTAAELADRAVSERLDALTPCAAATDDCARQFLGNFLPRAFRGPVTRDETERFLRLFRVGTSRGRFADGISMVIEAVLQSPRFLYRIESVPSADGPVVVDAYELASRLSYFLWASMPDERLFAAAADGRLSTVEGIESEASRMLRSPKARPVVAHFFMQWLDLEGLEGLPKDRERYPEFFSGVGSSWRASMEQYVENAVFGGGSVRDLFLEPVVYVDRTLASLYDLRPPPSGRLEAVGMDPDQRAGLLTQPALLARLAHPDQASPIRRGVFVRERILCQTLPSPPNNINITPPDPDPNATTRERFAAHTENESCRGCHSLIDPIGFGFSNYDALGRYQDHEGGRPVDATGELYGTTDPEIEGPFVGAVELSHKLADSSEVRACVATQVFRFAMGRAETQADECTLRELDRVLLASDSMERLLVAMTLTDVFRMKREGEAP